MSLIYFGEQVRG